MTMAEKTNWTGRVLRVRVDGPAQGGEFVARHEGRVVFCRGGITGELVEVTIDDDPGRAFCRGTVTEVLERSADRIDPLCPAAAAGAGCCDWSHIESRAARGFSGRILAEQTQRIGRIALPEETVAVEIPAGDDASTGWRTVARWVTGPDGVPGVRRARSRDLITETCVQADPRITAAVLSADVPPNREVLGVLGDDGEVHVAHRAVVDPVPQGRSRRSRQSATRARARHSQAGAWQHVTGPSTVVRRTGGHEWQLPVEAFWQAHRSAAEHYADRVRTAVTAAPGLPADPVIWDLYGGAGLFSAAVLDALPKARVTIVESARASLDSAGTALGTSSAVVPVLSRVEAFLDRSEGGDDDAPARPDVVILDPPRGGAGIEVMARLAGMAGSRIVHVGCDPASLARDVGALVSAGWSLVDLSGVAAFPATHHVEGIAVLDAPRSA